MEFYSAFEVQQLAPVLALCLGKCNASESLRQIFQRINSNDQIWDNFIIKNRLSTAKYLLRFEDSESSVIEAIQKHRHKGDSAHSALSPFNVASDLFPNGIISDAWFKKYLQDVPFAMVVVHNISEDTDCDALGQVLALDSKRCSDLGTGYIAIVISDGLDSKSDVEQLETLRRSSGLPYRSKLFFVNGLSESVEQDCSVVVSSIVKSLKSSALDFYSVIERRVYDRSDKYYTMPISNVRTKVKLSPKVLETRNLIKRGMLLQFMNPHNIEASLAVLEHAYENILELIADNAEVFSSNDKPPHDIALHKAWSRLLDVLIIHLVRGYFSIEEPIAALRKHQAHVQIGRDLLSALTPESVALWTAVQHHWLADLMALVPDGILHPKYKEAPKSEAMQFFGGVRLGDGSHVTTLPYLVYAEASAAIICCSDVTRLETDLLALHKESDLWAYKSRLLELSYNNNNSSAFHSSTFASFLKWQMAENYTAMQDFSSAVDSYDDIDSQIAFLSSRQHFLKKLLPLAVKHSDHTKLLTILLRHSFPEYDNVPVIASMQLPEIKIENLDDCPNYLEIEASLYNPSFSEETQAFDEVSEQFVVTSNFSPKLISNLFQDTKAFMNLEGMVVNFTDGQQLTLVSDGNQSGSIQTASIEEKSASFNFSKLGEHSLVLVATGRASSTGLLSIDTVVASMNIVLTCGDRELMIHKREEHKINHEKMQNSLKVYRSNGTNSTIRLKGRSPPSLLVKPYFPSFVIEEIPDLPFMILGEKLKVPIALSSDEIPLEKLAFSNIDLQVKATIYKNSEESKDLSMQANWEGLKDDEPFKLLQLVMNGQTQFTHSFHASISKSPNAVLDSHDEYKAVIDFSVNFTESSGNVSDVSLASLEVPVLQKFFNPTFETTPQLALKKDSVLSNPFVINPEKNDFSMPMPSRAWNLHCELNPHETKKGLIEVTGVELELQSKTNEITTKWISDTQQDQRLVSRSFGISGKHLSFPHSASLTVIANIQFTRTGLKEQLSQRVESKDLVLQLQDPRVLFQVDRVKNVYEFQYVIENPTSRIFTFSTSMKTDKALLHGSRWDFEDPRNVVPLVNNVLHVLPRSVTKLYYFGVVTTENGQEPELPTLQVFDVNYKVNLPTLALQRG